MKRQYYIITNIDGLVLFGENCKSLKEMLRKTGKDFKSFFNYDYQDQLTKEIGKDFIYLIDECQQYLNPYFRDAECILYFDMHGHLGHTVYLITQDRIKLTKQITTLVEKEIRFVQRSLLLTSRNFTYKEIIAGDITGRRTIAVDKTVFELYTSQFAEETEKPKNSFMKYIYMMVAALIISGYFLVQRLTAAETPKATQPGQTKMTMKNEPIKTDRYKKKKNTNKHIYDEAEKKIWVEVSYIKLGEGYHLIEDPITKEFTPPSVYPYNIMKSGKLRLYAHVRQTDLPEKELAVENNRFDN